MKTSLRHGFAVMLYLAASIFAAACDQASNIENESSNIIEFGDGSTALMSQSGSVDVHAMSKGLAIILRDEDNRKQLYRMLRDRGKTRELKLNSSDLKEFLERQVAPSTEVAKLVNIMNENVSGELGDIEVYIPVKKVRHNISAMDRIVVAVGMEEDNDPVGYDVNGRYVKLSREIEPDFPVLVITRSETNFNNASKLELEYVDDSMPKECSDEPLEVLPPECGGGGGGGAGNLPPGIYYTSGRIDDLREPWFRGEPEIEIHVVPNFDANHYSFNEWRTSIDYLLGTYHHSITTSRCEAGEGRSGLRHFNQDGHNFVGNVLIMTEAELNAISNGAINDAVGFAFWEDDYAKCELYTENSVMEFVGSSVINVGGWLTSAAAFGSNPNLLTLGSFAALSVYVGYSIVDGAYRIFSTNDDLIGVALKPVQGQDQYQFYLQKERFYYNGNVTLKYIR